MNTLQEAVERGLRALPRLALATLVRRKFKDQGIRLSQKRSELIANELISGKTQFSIPNKKELHVDLQITPEDIQNILDKLKTFLEEGLQPMFDEISDQTAVPVLATLKAKWPLEEVEQEAELAPFLLHLGQRWGRSISLLRMLLTIGRELGSSINSMSRQGSVHSDSIVDVVTRLHARACQVTDEVITLLQAGFANGALARWRTLHEIRVTAEFIFASGSDCATRYLEHDVIESYRAAIEYEEVRKHLHYKRISRKEMTALRSRHDEAVRKYGKAFAGQYGWAAQTLANNKPTFKDIQRSVGTDHLRGHYRLASYGVHANPKGILFSLTSVSASNTIPTGPSNGGLADAGQHAANTLTAISGTLVQLAPTMDHLVALKVMVLLNREVGTAFVNAHRKLLRDEIKLVRQEKQDIAAEAQGRNTPPR